MCDGSIFCQIVDAKSAFTLFFRAISFVLTMMQPNSTKQHLPANEKKRFIRLEKYLKIVLIIINN